MAYKRRSAAEIFKWAAFLKKKENEKQAKIAQQILRVSRVSVIFLVIINSILAIDVFLLAPQTKYDQLDYIESYMTYSRRGGGSRHYVLHTTSGRHWELNSASGFDLHGEKIRIKQTPLFKMAYEFFLMEHSFFIYRAYDPISVSKYFSIISLVVGMLAIFMRLLHNDNYTPLAILISVATAAQCVLMLL